MLKAVIFDMDGVIIDSEPFHLWVNIEIFKKLGVNAGEEVFKRFIGSSHTQMWTTIKNEFNLTQSVPELVQMQVQGNLDYLRNANDEKPISGILELLEDLKVNEISIGLASSSAMEGIDLVLDNFNIRSYFKELVSGEHMKRSKPAPDIFLKAAELLNVKPEECMVIEDAKYGVMAAKAAGMKCIGFQNVNSGDQDLSLADMIVDSMQKVNVEMIKCMF